MDSSTSKKDRLLKSSVLVGNPLSNFPQTTPQTQKEKNTGVEIEQEFHSVLIQSPSLNNAKTLEIKNSIHTNTIESVNITQKSKKSNQTRRNKIQTEDGFTNTHLERLKTLEPQIKKAKTNTFEQKSQESSKLHSSNLLQNKTREITKLNEKVKQYQMIVSSKNVIIGELEKELDG